LLAQKNHPSVAWGAQSYGAALMSENVLNIAENGMLWDRRVYILDGGHLACLFKAGETAQRLWLKSRYPGPPLSKVGSERFFVEL
jgi:hypothetical protein